MFKSRGYYRLIFAYLTAVSGGVQAAPSFERDAVPFLKKYCYECHGEKEQEGGIEFHQVLTTDSAFRSHRLLDEALRQVVSGKMPPDEADHFPSTAEILKFQQSVGALLKKIENGDVPRNPGRATIRRLNRNEYNYTVRDLFGVNFSPGRDFPADGSGGEGFDNTGDTLFLPPVLMEKYVRAAGKVIDAVYASPKLRKRVFFIDAKKAQKEPQKSARKLLSYHAARAYRRRVTDADLVLLLKAFNQSHSKGADFETAMRAPLTALLVSPRFLFRVQHDQAGKNEWRLNQFEIASRLSYFLWSSMPDRTLFRLADEGKLHDPKVLQEQVRRMIASKKSDTLARHFAGQWLGFDDLIDQVEPDKSRFPRFTRSLRASMYYESIAYFNHFIRNNRPAYELVHTDYAFLNEELAAHYGISGVQGRNIRKVALANKNRGGVIGMGSVLTATSLPLRTSPVKRGKWILEALLGTPPPPPPPDAGELPADDKTPDGLSFRKQLEIHRKKRKCAGCHAKIDPLGFGLENYDAIGRWRTKDVHGVAVDSDAVLPDGTKFSTPSELKAILMKDKDKIARNLCRKMLAYALGRPLEYYDEPVINDLIKTMRANDYRVQPLILAIVQSHPFQYRSNKR